MTTWAVKVIIGDAIEGEWMPGKTFKDVCKLRHLAAEMAGQEGTAQQVGAFLPYTATGPNGVQYSAHKVHRFAAVAPWGTITLWVQKED